MAYDLGVIVIGVNPEWNQQVNIGKHNNPNFVMLPHGKFVEMIGDKAEECDIRVTVREESYTSKASALDFDEISTLDKKSSGMSS